MSVSRQNSMAVWASQKRSRELSGSVPFLVLGVLTVLFVSGGGYLYAVNQSAVQGYHMRTLEKEISTLRQENAKLRIVEADLRSLQRIEASGAELNMEKLEASTYLEGQEPIGSLAEAHQGGPVALR